ncbi:MAG TPA: DNA repair protein RecO [Polyangiaceae bacterium]|jgi:DNA repair protein RecO (recombination protein O)|nr:DNA repair protein RecO [Polyangiaceae bacterium]
MPRARAGNVRPSGKRASISTKTEALVVRRVQVGEADLLVTALTRAHGQVSISARGARRATSRLGPLEPMHTLELGLALVPGVEIARLTESKIVTPRLGLLDDPVRLDLAARVLAWGRDLVPPLSPEPRAFDIVEATLDALGAPAESAFDAILVGAGLQLLVALGFGLELGACVGCGTPCPRRASAYVDAGRGGLVCRACGGAREILPTATRMKLASASAGIRVELDVAEAAVGIRVVEEAISAQRGARPRRTK